MDIQAHLELRTAPQVVFDALPERRHQTRFMVRAGASWKAVTWQTFADEIRHLALYVDAHIETGERCAIFAKNSVAWFAAALGIQAARGVMVPIYASSTAAQAKHIVEHSDAKVLFVDSSTLPRVQELCAGLSSPRMLVLLEDVSAHDALGEKTLSAQDAIRFGQDADAKDPERFSRLLAAADLDEDALMLYTSGTSGAPKGVPLTHRNVGVNGRDWFESNAPLLEENYTDLLWLPMSHIFGFGEAAIGNRLGWTSYLSDPKSVLRDLSRVKPQVFMSVPSVWEKIATAAAAHAETHAEFRRISGGALRFCLSGGAGLKPSVKEFFWDQGVLIIEGYGLTECSPTLTLNRPDAFRFDSVGQPFPSVELKLADDGEILARGASVFRAYHNDPEATQEAFDAEGWFKTGDIGRWTDDGFLQIVDRKKDILVTAGGKNIAPANIEQQFHDDALVEHAVVYGDGQKYLVAALWLKPSSEEPPGNREEDAAKGGALARRAQASVDAVNAKLPRHETIKKFIVVDEPLSVDSGLLTPTLKIRRKHIYARYGERLRALYGGH